MITTKVSQDTLRFGQEVHSQANYSYNLVSKSQRAYSACSDVSKNMTRIALAFSKGIDHQVHSNASTITTSVATMSHRVSTFSWMTQSCQKICHQINLMPAVIVLKKGFFIKQNIDFAIATSQWIFGYRSHSSMLHNFVNTALVYTPIFLSKISLAEAPMLSCCANIMLIGILAYSLRQDILGIMDPKTRESSPSVSLLKKAFFRA